MTNGKLFVQLLCGLTSLAFVAGCGGGGGGGGSTSTPTAITAVTASCNPTSVLTGQTSQCTATVTGTGSYNSAVTWSVSGVQGGNSTVGSISTSGLYTAPSVVPATSPVTVTATSTEDTTKSGSPAITIGPGLVSIQVTPAYPSATVGGTQQFAASGTFSDSSTKNLTGTVTWSSSSAAAATVNTSGLATAAAVGTTTIKAASGSVNGSTSLVVTAATVGTDAAAAVTDGSGMATLISNGLTVPVQLTDQDSGATLAGVAVALGTDPSVPGSATLIIADPTGVHPLQLILFEGAPSTSAATGPVGATRHARLGHAQLSVSGAVHANAGSSPTAIAASTGCPTGSGTTASQAITLSNLPAPPSPISMAGAQTQIIDAINALQSLGPKSIPAGMYGPISVTQYSPTIASDCVQDVQNVLAEHVNAQNGFIFVLEQVPQLRLAGKLADLYALWKTRAETISAAKSCYYQTGQPQTINISQVCFGASCVFIPQIEPLPNPGPGLAVAASVTPMVNSLMTFESNSDIGLTVLGTTDSTGTGEVGVPEGANTVCVDSSGYQQFTEPGFIVSAPGTPLDVTLTPPGPAQIYSGSYSAPFSGTASDPDGGVYAASVSLAVTLNLTQNSDGSITGSANIPANINITVVSCPSNDTCAANSFTDTATGSVTGSNGNITGNLSSGGTDPFTINFTGVITGNSIAVTGGFSTTLVGTGSAGPPISTTLSGTITGLTLAKQ
jgi:Bacterial Ig-like domain (group 2)